MAQAVHELLCNPELVILLPSLPSGSVMGYRHLVYVVLEAERQASRLQGKQVLYQLSPCLLMTREFNSSKPT